MKLPLFFLLALCMSKAAAFGLYGCYERLLYWQAYQMDSQSKKQKIAKGCSKDQDTIRKVGKINGGRCNLRQFLYYIATDPKEKAAIVNKLTDAELAWGKETKLDDIASKLTKAGVGNAIHPGRIYENLRHDSLINELINYVATFIEQKRYVQSEFNLEPELFERAELARSRALFGRRANAARDIGTEIRKKYDNAVWEKQPKNDNGKVMKDAPLVDEGLVKERMGIPKGSEGAIDGWITCDLTAAKESVDAEETKAGRDPIKLKDFIIPWKENENSHEQNINALETAKTKISGCST